MFAVNNYQKRNTYMFAILFCKNMPFMRILNVVQGKCTGIKFLLHSFAMMALRLCRMAVSMFFRHSLRMLIFMPILTI